jgi:hypothetical protein
MSGWLVMGFFAVASGMIYYLRRRALAKKGTQRGR